jgi:hypothetical protein
MYRALLIAASLALVACGDEPSQRPLPPIPPAGAGGPPDARVRFLRRAMPLTAAP